MTRQGDTKKRILALISQGDNSLSAISAELGLAPSTVSKHLHDLESSGAIAQKENNHIKKWKHYEIGPRYAESRSGGFGFNRKYLALAIALAAIASLSVFAYSHLNVPAYAAGTTYVPISITDPPQVPPGTQALYVNYSSLAVHVIASNSSGWLPVNSSGRIDLMGLINESQIIGGVSVGLNSTINMVRFNITSASITIDNVTYGVVTKSGLVSAEVENSTRVNDTSSILLDFSPVVAPIYAQNETLFVLLPSLRAVVAPSTKLGITALATSAGAYLPSRFALQQPYRAMFQGPANLTIKSSALLSKDNVTYFSVTLGNSGSKNVTVMGILVDGDAGMPVPIGGNGTLMVTSGAPGPGIQSSAEIAGVPGYAQRGAAQAGVDQRALFNQSNSSIEISAAAMYGVWQQLGTGSINITLNTPVRSIKISGVGAPFNNPSAIIDGARAGFAFVHAGSMGFMVGKNGTLSPPSQMQIISPDDAGYVLAANSTRVFAYNGAITIGGGMLVVIPSNNAYGIVVATDRGPLQANFTSG